ncbi:L-seryl-tRNA(Sec) selenium transferase [Candidatus Fermentibacteria bacterium]|nr:MAG: L-seryl-tRNA(Sec) selenium transferase [Candidatus Fermentibacteria bacterium]
MGMEQLKNLPAVHQIVPVINDKLTGLTPLELREAARAGILWARETVASGGELPGIDQIISRCVELASAGSRPTMETVINATGIVLHTALGRASLPPAAIEAVRRVASGYSVLQWNRKTGKRGSRDEHIAHLITAITGAEAATVANNNAGATLLVLSAMAAGKEVIVSRGQLVEIGGSFRIPEVMKQSNCTMVEVGCTNRTHLRDYENAVTENTAAILRVHPSNYRVKGFTGEVELEELVALGRQRGIPVIDDLGAGSLIPLNKFGIPSEPTIVHSVKTGADVITCSGDKLIGGPQAGIILGREKYLSRIKKHPLARALRVGKLTIAALQASLRIFLETPEYIAENHPVYRSFSVPVEKLRERAQVITGILEQSENLVVSVGSMDSFVGSGSLPDFAIPSAGVSVRCPDPEKLASALRLSSPAVACRVENDALQLDLRAVAPEQDEMLAGLVAEKAGELWG